MGDIMAKLVLIIAALSGATSVILGAFAAHGLKAKLPENLLSAFSTGVEYQMYHSLALLAVGLMLNQWSQLAGLKVAAVAFMLGILLFSGSLYGLALTGQKWLGPITPLGGLAFIVAWLSLAWSFTKL